MELDRKQDPNVLYQVCVLRTDWKNKMAALADLSKSGTLYSGARYGPFGPLVIDLELIIFPVQLGCYGYGSHCKVLCDANMSVTLFRVSADQISVFSITKQSR